MAQSRPSSLPAGWRSWPDERKRALRDRYRLARFRSSYRYRLAAFAHECINWPEGEGLTTYQAEALDELISERRLSLRGPHGLGKTGIASIAILGFALTRDGVDDWKAPTTASKWRQLTEYLWPEIHKWARLLRWDVIGREPFDDRLELQVLSLRLSTGSAFAAASDQPSAIEGAHADQLLYVYDEAKTIPEQTFDATEGAFSGADPARGREAYALAISTPGEPTGRFYQIHARAPGFEDWHVRHVQLDEAIAAGRISEAWAEQRARQWGKASPLFQNRVLGNFASSERTSVIPLPWVEAAQERWKALAVQRTNGEWFIPAELVPLDCVGVDVGGGEEDADKSVLALRHGDVITEIREYGIGDTMETTGKVVGVLRVHEKAHACVDVIGLGAGPVSRLREQGFQVVAFNAAEASNRTDASGELEFANRRAEAWWAMRERLDPAQPGGATLALPPNDELTGDLTAPRWKTTSAGRVLIESKKDIRQRIGRSTDVGDAVIQAVWSRMAATTVSSAAELTFESLQRRR